MLSNIYNQKITILNKLKRADSGQNVDVWYKTVIDDAAWYAQVARTVSNGNVLIGSYIKCLIPYHKEYLSYSDWKKSSCKESHYTMCAGDYIVLGEVTEDVTPSNVVQLMSTYEPNVCLVKHTEELHDRFNSYVQLRVEGS
jgi:hypothetical protein